MKSSNIARLRVEAQLIPGSAGRSAAGLLSWLGAVQAQDYTGALWAMGLRLRTTHSAVEEAIAKREIVRTWPMRGTLHFVSARDIAWMLRLLAPRIIAGSAGRYRQLELDLTTFRRSRASVERALRGGQIVSRDEIYASLERSGISTTGQRGIHILRQLALEGLICGGPRREKSPTFVWLDEWIAKPDELEREQALQRLTLRYFSSHGPATVRDFAAWSGLTLSDVRKGLDLAGDLLERLSAEGQDYWLARERAPLTRASAGAFLLPGFDELLLGYRDRSAVLPREHAEKICPSGNGIFFATLLIAGQVCGTWKLETKRGTCAIQLAPFSALSSAQRRAINVPMSVYQNYMECPMTLSLPGE